MYAHSYPQIWDAQNALFNYCCHAEDERVFSPAFWVLYNGWILSFELFSALSISKESEIFRINVNVWKCFQKFKGSENFYCLASEFLIWRHHWHHLNRVYCQFLPTSKKPTTRKNPTGNKNQASSDPEEVCYITWGALEYVIISNSGNPSRSWNSTKNYFLRDVVLNLKKMYFFLCASMALSGLKSCVPTHDKFDAGTYV